MARPTFYKKKPAKPKASVTIQAALDFTALDNLPNMEQNAIRASEDAEFWAEIDTLFAAEPCRTHPRSKAYEQRSVANIHYSVNSELGQVLADAASRIREIGLMHVDKKAPRYSKNAPEQYIDYALRTLCLRDFAEGELDTPEKRFVSNEVFRLAAWGATLFNTPLLTAAGQEAVLIYVKSVAARLNPFLTARSSELFA